MPSKAAIKNAEQLRRDIVAFIEEYWDEHGYAPSRRDIVAGTRVSSTSSISYHLLILRNRGVVVYDECVARSIRVVDIDPVVVEA